jgi:hypothetical protein
VDARAQCADLQVDRLGERVRLEQERIGYGWLERALKVIVTSSTVAAERGLASS